MFLGPLVSQKARPESENITEIGQVSWSISSHGYQRTDLEKEDYSNVHKRGSLGQCDTLFYVV